MGMLMSELDTYVVCFVSRCCTQVLHPSSSIPGPRLAAATYLPEFWHDVVMGGRYTYRIREMHEKYGQ